MSRHSAKSRSGSILVIVMLITVLLFSLTLVVGQDALQNMGSTSGTMDRKQARYAAFAGLQLALAQLNNTTDEHWASAAPVVMPGIIPGNPRLTFEVEIRNNIYGDIAASIVPKGAVKLDSRALFGDSGVTRKVSGLSGTAIQYNPSFDQAVLSSTVSLVNGSQSIAFDFTKYTDRSQGVAMNATDTAAAQDSTWKKGGKVVSNEHITVDTAGFINGDVSFQNETTTTGGILGGTAPTTPLIKTVHYSGERVTSAGNTIPAARAPYDKASATTDKLSFKGAPIYNTWYDKDGKKHVDLVGYQPVPLDPGPYNNITVPAGETMQLHKGTYYFADTFTVNGSVVLDGSGQVIIYVGKKMVVNSGGDVNFNGNPRDIQTYFTDEDKTPDPTDKLPLPTTFSVSRLEMDGGKATMLVAGAKLRAKIDHSSRLLGALVSDTALFNDKSTAEFDSNLAGQASLLKSEWKLTGIHEP